MSQENLEIVRRIVDGWGRGDFSETDGFHPDVEFELVDWPERARTRGDGGDAPRVVCNAQRVGRLPLPAR